MLSESAPLISQLSKYLAGSAPLGSAGAGVLVVMLSSFVLIVITAWRQLFWIIDAAGGHQLTFKTRILGEHRLSACGLCRFCWSLA